MTKRLVLGKIINVLSGFIFFIFSVSGTGLSQNPTFQNFTIESGLPSNTVYHIMKDSDGFLWAATDAGVSRYDGRKFENFTMADGLGDNEILKIVEDPYQRIWFLPYNGRLSYYRKGKFYNDENDERLRAIKNYSPYCTNLTGRNKYLWLGTTKNGFVRIGKDNFSLNNS